MNLRQSRIIVKEYARQGRIIFKEYALKFHQLSCYAPELVSSKRARMGIFLLGYPMTWC